MTELNLEEIIKRKREEIMKKEESIRLENSRFKIVDEDIHVGYGEILTIEAGSIWKFAAGKGIYVEGGLLRILGTEEKPIILEAQFINWNGITIEDSKLDNIVEHITIKYAKKEEGGGIYINKSILRLDYSIIEKCEAEMGGGIFNEKSDVIIRNSFATRNSATDRGGGMFNSQSEVKIENSSITENTANNNGGGICNWMSNIRIEDSCITKNSSGNKGGGIYNFWFKDFKLGKTIKEGSEIIQDGSEIIQLGKNDISNNTPDDIKQHKETYKMMLPSDFDKNIKYINKNDKYKFR